MKRLILIVVLAAAWPLYAQDTAPPEAPAPEAPAASSIVSSESSESIAPDETGWSYAR